VKELGVVPKKGGVVPWVCGDGLCLSLGDSVDRNGDGPEEQDERLLRDDAVEDVDDE